MRYKFANHDSWETFIGHGVTYRSILVLLGLDGTFDFRDVVINSTAPQANRQNIVFNFMELVIGMELDNPKTSGMIDLKNVVQFVDNGGLGSTEGKRNGPIVKSSRDGMKHGDAVDIMKIGA